MTIQAYEAQARRILDALDELREDSEALDELNAEFEDALFMLSSIDPRTEDPAEAMLDALDVFDALAEDYRRQPEAKALADQLDALSRQARADLEG
ncbi:MAG: hypothetical protein IJJ45_01950 [Clostridia bacterium]|nr:hypothetical protein [Clostridia bacterium]